jgi:predicted MFS family arabinose efflux permease
MAQWTDFASVFVTAGGISLLVLGLLLWALPPRAFPRAPATSSGRGLSGVKAVLRNGPLVGCWVVTLGACFGLGMFTSFVPLHARDQGLTVSQIGLVFLTQGLCNGLSRIPFGRLSDCVPRRAVLVTAGMLGYILALAAVGLARSNLAFLVFGALTGIGLGLAFTSVGALIAETVPAASRGLAMGGYNTSIYLGMMASSAAMGAIIERIGFKAAFSLTAAFCLVTLLIFSRLLKGFDPHSLPPGD